MNLPTSLFRLSIRSFVVCATIATSILAASAQGLLGGDFRTATLHDFVSHFNFKELQKSPGVSGITEHIFGDSEGTLLLTLGASPDSHVVHLKLIMPRDLIDDPKQTLGGRDIVKSFIGAATESQADYLSLSSLKDEVDVRDLDLHPVQMNASTFADTGKPIPKNAYKIGSGPLQKNDRITFIGKMPVLTKTPSTMYSAFAGRAKTATLAATGCRLEFANGTIDGVPVLTCEAWDQSFFKTNLASKQGASEQQAAADPKASLNQAVELIATKDPVKSRLAEQEIGKAEQLGSDDFRIPSLKALAALQIGRRSKGLAPLRAAIKSIPSGSKYESFTREMTAAADEMQKKMEHSAPPPVPAEKRKYIIQPGTAAVIAEKDEATGLVTMGIGGSHDPDGGKQDGVDDGIIQVLLSNINPPDDVIRAK